MLRPGNVERPCESVARDYRLVPSAGVVLAVGDPGHRSLALAMAPVAAISPGRNYIRRHVRAAAGDSVSAPTPIRIPRQFHGSSFVTCEFGLAWVRFCVSSMRTCQGSVNDRTPISVSEVNHR